MIHSYRSICCVSLVFVIILTVGCRSSRSGTARSERVVNTHTQLHRDSTNFQAQFAAYLQRMETDMHIRILEFFPPVSGDSAANPSLKSVTDISFAQKESRDSLREESRLVHASDSVFEQSSLREKTYDTYRVKKSPWYQPFLPYFVLAFFGVLYSFFKKK